MAIVPRVSLPVKVTDVTLAPRFEVLGVPAAVDTRWPLKVIPARRVARSAHAPPVLKYNFPPSEIAQSLLLPLALEGTPVECRKPPVVWSVPASPPGYI